MDIKNQTQARAFNPFLKAKSTKLKNLIEEVQTQIDGYEHYYKTRKRARRAVDQLSFKRMIEAILCDLCLVFLDARYEAVHLPLSNKVLRKASRYKSPVLGKTLPDLLRIMESPEMDFVKLTKGRTTFKVIDQDLNMAPAGGIQSTLTAGPKLTARIHSFAITQDDIAWSDEQETIVLRAPKTPRTDISEALEYEDNDNSLHLRQQMQAINQWVAAADIDCSLAEVNSNDRYLRRIFNNASYEQGGRLYGGFWQRIKADERTESIFINEDAVVECDYGQMSILLLYAEAGEQDQLPEGDLYDLSDYGIPEDYRAGIKKVMQAIINSPNVPKRMPKGARQHFPSRISLNDVLKAIEKRHARIFSLMRSNLGMQLFRKESDILVEVLLTLKRQSVVALPIHDAVLVADEDKDTAVRVMKEVFNKHTGITPEVTS